MRCFMRMRLRTQMRFSISSSSHDNACLTLHLSTLSESSRKSLSASKRTSQQGPESNPPSVNSLFQQIAEILGADEVALDKIPAEISVSEKTYLPVHDSSWGISRCTIDVCENAQEKPTLLVSEDTSGAVDASPLVRKIAAAVRAENDMASMEDRLERLECRFDDPDVVDKVLKWCFRVPHLAFRFFNWVKTRDGFCHATNTYNTMLLIAGEANEIHFLNCLVEEMNEKSVDKDFKTWTILISLYGKATLLSRALMCFYQMKKSGFEPDSEVYKIVIQSACNAGKGELALELYKEMVQRNMEVDLSLYKLLLDCMIKSGDPEAVNLIADDMTRVSHISERDAYISVLKSYCLAGRIREALELIRDLKDTGIHLDSEYFETLVNGLCITDRIRDALEMIEIMKKRNLHSAKAYEFVINAHLGRKELSRAFDLFQSMKQSGLAPTSSTYEELIQHMFNLDEYQQGCRLYTEMLERGLDVDSMAIMAVVAGHVRHHHLLEAWEVFRSTETKGIKPTRESYAVFIKELCRISRTEEILKVLHEMQEAKISINDKIFDCVISCMESKGEKESVEKVNQLQKISILSSPNGDTSTTKVPILKPNHSQQEQRRMTEKKCSVKPVSKGYLKQDLLKVCSILSSSSGDWSVIGEALEKSTVKFTPELVLEVLRNCSIYGKKALNFFSWVGKQPGYCQTVDTYNMAMKISGRGKDFKHMRSLFNEMRRKRYPVTPDTWTIIIMQYGRTGMTEIALNIFKEMKKSNCNPSESTYKHLIICLCEGKGKKVDEAMKFFQEMIRSGFVPDKELAEIYLRCLCEAGKLAEARSCINSLNKLGFTVSFSSSLYIRALCRTGRLEEAISMLDEGSGDHNKLKIDRSTYASLVHGLLRRGKTEEAFAKLESMRKASIRPTAHVYTSLIVHFFKEEQPEKAEETLETMQREGCKPTIVTYSAMVRGYMKLGKTSEAWTVFRPLREEGPSPDFQTYSMFISCLCKAGESEKAFKLLSEMVESRIIPSAVNFREVFFGLNREGKQDLARSVLQKKWNLIENRKFLT